MLGGVIASVQTVQDDIIPYLADERHAPDTLFLVTEEDFRCFNRHSACQPAGMASLAKAAFAARRTSYAAWTTTLTKECSEPVALPLDELYAWRYSRSTSAGSVQNRTTFPIENFVWSMTDLLAGYTRRRRNSELPEASQAREYRKVRFPQRRT